MIGKLNKTARIMTKFSCIESQYVTYSVMKITSVIDLYPRGINKTKWHYLLKVLNHTKNILLWLLITTATADVKIMTKVDHFHSKSNYRRVLRIVRHTIVNSKLSRIKISNALQCASFWTFCNETICSCEYLITLHNISLRTNTSGTHHDLPPGSSH